MFQAPGSRRSYQQCFIHKFSLALQGEFASCSVVASLSFSRLVAQIPRVGSRRHHFCRGLPALQATNHNINTLTTSATIAASISCSLSSQTAIIRIHGSLRCDWLRWWAAYRTLLQSAQVGHRPPGPAMVGSEHVYTAAVIRQCHERKPLTVRSWTFPICICRYASTP